MSEPVDLWGDLGTEETVPPVTFLKEQASLLRKKTQFTLSGDVETTHQGSDVVHTFTVVAHALDSYRFMLSRMRHNIDLYPVYIFWNNENYQAEDEATFQKMLGHILSSESTQRVVKSLLAQSKA